MNILIASESNALSAEIQSALHCDHNFILANNSRLAIEVLKNRNVDALICSAEIKGNVDAWRLSRLVRTGTTKASPTLHIIIVEMSSSALSFVAARNHEVELVPANKLARLEGMLDTETPLHRPRLLVIEDTEDNAYFVKCALSKEVDVDVAETGEEGILKYKASRYDAVLTDVMLPSMNGMDVLKAILEINPQQPVIVMTAHAARDADIFLEAGATDFIAKPFKAQQLKDVVRLACSRGKIMEAYKSSAGLNHPPNY